MFCLQVAAQVARAISQESQSGTAMKGRGGLRRHKSAWALEPGAPSEIPKGVLTKGERSSEGQKGRLAEDRVFDKRCPCIRGLEKRFLPNISFFSMI